jgi:ABC-type spermidine/putrescine transport system permease subunit I
MSPPLAAEAVPQHRSRRRLRFHPGLLIVPAILLLAITYLLPLAQLLRLSFSEGGPENITGEGFTLSHYADFVTDPVALRVIWRSIWIAAVTTVIAVILAYPYAACMVRSGPKVRKGLVAIALLPMTTSGVVRAYGVIMILSQTGPVNSLLLSIGIINEPLQLLYGPIALIIGNIYFCLPFVILPLAAGISKLDQRLIDASSTLGADKSKTFINVTLPLLIPSLAAGSTIAFTLTMTSYVTPGLLGGHGYLVITTLLGQKMFDLANWISGAVVSMVLLVTVLAFTSIYQTWLDRRSRFYVR